MYKYSEILDDLEKKIEDHFYKTDEKLPTENELATEYGASRTTIKKVMSILAKQGYVYRRRGDGSYANDLSEQQLIKRKISTQFGGFTTSNKGNEVSTKILEFDCIVPDENILRSLKLKSGSKVYYARRLRYINGEPIVIEEAYLNMDIVQNLTENVLLKSLHNYIENDLGHKIHSAHRRVTARIPSNEQKKLLKLDDDAAILRYQQTVFLDTGFPFQYSISYNNSKHIDLYQVLTK